MICCWHLQGLKSDASWLSGQHNSVEPKRQARFHSIRKKLKFKGVIFSDDMHMKAISAEYDLKKTIELSINAGVDVMLFSGNALDNKSTFATDIIKLVIELLNEHKISQQSIDASYKRIMVMKGLRV